jgi:GH18 family chitinase
MRRPCHSFYPEQIPVGVYTHLNYAFASIDPKTFEVLPPSTYEKDLMKRLTALKRSDPDLKVYIAVGGWTFNDPGPTATVFSDIARSEANQKAFFKSLISFMSTYNFDGIDLDWEYPVAEDRSGRPEDYKNFPSFIANLKRALKASGGRDGLTITLPASYWYLQNFDIVNLQKDVDFFNIMSYDLHGAWDRNNKWLAPELNSHTNLTEITNALDLLWRNDINPEKVVLGLAFYARVFSATSPSCMEPGCTFQSGGNAGVCSNEVGILLNSEIVEIMNDRQVKPTLDKDAAVKILKFDNNQWLTYDDADTFKLKAEFARGQCLGGVMVWAVSHDLPYGNYSRALGEVANRKVKALAMSTVTDELETRKVHQQCKWTNCFENCPAGWTLIARSDSGARKGEGMLDNASCGRRGDHLFCCPPDSPLPTCGWYGHRNGKCNGRGNCPEKTVEIGSHSRDCENNNYQAACCTFDTPSMKLYSQCTWAESPKCDEGVCPNTLVAESSTGSGGDYCKWKTFKYTWNGQEATYQERKYCCDQKDDTKWEDCEWFDNVGIFSVDSAAVDGYCASGCPNDRVRVALETRNGCEGDGGRARCCKPKYITLSKRSYTDAETSLEQSVKEFMDDPSCGIDDYWKRDLVLDDYLLGNVTSCT